MDIKQINQTLERIFNQENRRLVFWYDGEKEFEESLHLVEIQDVSVIRLDEISSLALKIRIEIEDVQGKYLIYAPYYEPDHENDWLLDIKLYSTLFHADKASIIIKELGITNLSLKPFIKERNGFFRSQERIDKLKKWVEPTDTEDDIDLKMLTVLTRADQPEPFAILMKLLNSFCTESKFDETIDSKSWKDIESLGLGSSFWKFMLQTFGYSNESAPTLIDTPLIDLLLKIFVTDFSNNLKCSPPVSISHFMLSGTSKVMNCSVFINQWQRHTIYCKNFNLISKYISERLNVYQIISYMQIEELLDVYTFENVEQKIISSFRDQIINYRDKDFSAISETIKKRLDGFWTTAFIDNNSKKNLYKSAYRALEISIKLFELRNRYDDHGFSYKSADEMFKAYTDELFLFDKYYRIFNELANITEQGGWDVLKLLRTCVEDCYSNWFMENLSIKWGDFLQCNYPSNTKDSYNNIDSYKEGSSSVHGLLERWHIQGIRNQYNFFKETIFPLFSKSDRNRIFVIISDAFRYEAAKEMADQINGKYRFEAKIEPMLGTLPSFTGLGMASLLPYKSLSFKEDSANPLIDGKPTSSIEQRAAILKAFDGTAVKSSDLSAMNKDKGRDFVKLHRVIYIYHDHIDAVGDKAVSEDKTFEAVRAAIDELTSLVEFIINSLNGTKVIITADHGFIYQEKEPEKLDKSILEIEPESAVKKHKRFIMGKGLQMSDKVFVGSTKETANTDTDMKFWLPKGTNRFNFIGGAKFFHGGAMLQEITIPLLTVSELKGANKEKSQVGMVGVSLLGSTKKIVTNIPKFEFIQTDEVSQRMKPRTLKISLRDGNDIVSSEEIITFDSTSSSMDERKKSVRLPLKSEQFDNKKEYALVLRNAADETEYDRIPLIIDIAFANDF